MIHLPNVLLPLSIVTVRVNSRRNRTVNSTNKSLHFNRLNVKMVARNKITNPFGKKKTNCLDTISYIFQMSSNSKSIFMNMFLPLYSHLQKSYHTRNFMSCFEALKSLGKVFNTHLFRNL